MIEADWKRILFEKNPYTVEPRYPRSFYLRIRLFTFEILIKKGQISSQNVSFYLRIQYSRSQIAGYIYSG
jgi:hypothetical protein